MAIKIKIEKPTGTTEAPAPQVVEASVELKARRSLSGDIMIFDHRDIDIVLMTEKKKVVAFAKEFFGEHVYEAQDRLFKFLARKGIISQESVQGGNIFYSMEASIQETKDYDIVQNTLFTIGKFIDTEKPIMAYDQAFEDEEEKRLSEPPPGEYTEFDPELHAAEKGSIKPKMQPYGVSSFYRI